MGGLQAYAQAQLDESVLPVQVSNDNNNHNHLPRQQIGTCIEPVSAQQQQQQQQDPDLELDMDDEADEEAEDDDDETGAQSDNDDRNPNVFAWMRRGQAAQGKFSVFSL